MQKFDVNKAYDKSYEKATKVQPIWMRQQQKEDISVCRVYTHNIGM